MVNAWKVGEIDGRYNLLKQDIDRDGTKLLKITIHITEALLVPQSSTLKKSLKTYAVKLDSARKQLKSQVLIFSHLIPHQNSYRIFE